MDVQIASSQRIHDRARSRGLAGSRPCETPSLNVHCCRRACSAASTGPSHSRWISHERAAAVNRGKARRFDKDRRIVYCVYRVGSAGLAGRNAGV